MSTQITIQMAANVLQRATRIAAQKNQSVEQLLTNLLERASETLPIDELPDEEVLALTELKLTDEQQDLLDELLEENRTGTLTPEGEKRLDELMDRNGRGLLRKAEALQIATQRGLLPSLKYESQ